MDRLHLRGVRGRLDFTRPLAGEAEWRESDPRLLARIKGFWCVRTTT